MGSMITCRPFGFRPALAQARAGVSTTPATPGCIVKTLSSSRVYRDTHTEQKRKSVNEISNESVRAAFNLVS